VTAGPSLSVALGHAVAGSLGFVRGFGPGEFSHGKQLSVRSTRHTAVDGVPPEPSLFVITGYFNVHAVSIDDAAVGHACLPATFGGILA
jgi:hypothetical protein